jgi:hypothetical protein
MEGGKEMGGSRAKKLRDSLQDQLKNKGADTAHFRALIEDYIWLDTQMQAMKKSIKEDGPMVEAVSAAGKTYQRENPAVKNVVLYSRQMLAILRDMDLSTENTVMEDEDEL